MANDITHLTPQDLSDRWGGHVKVGTLALWRVQGKGPVYMKLGKRVLYAIVDVEEWEAENRRKNTVDPGRR